MTRKTYAMLFTTVIVATTIAVIFVVSRSAERNNDLNETERSFTETYANAEYDFSFRYPAGFIVYAMPDGEGIAITANDKESDKGFQVTVSPFNESLQSLTVERIKRDLPDLEINNPKEITVDGEGGGVSFTSDPSRQIWFIARGNLYQTTASEDSEDILKSALSTWRFNERIR